MSVKECPNPSTRIREAPATSSRTCSTLEGRCRIPAR
jgi:hypothetical protein